MHLNVLSENTLIYSVIIAQYTLKKKHTIIDALASFQSSSSLSLLCILHWVYVEVVFRHFTYICCINNEEQATAPKSIAK